MISAVYTFLLALFLSTALVPLLVKIAPALKLVDRPGVRKIHDHVIPRIGGIAIVAGMLVPVLLWVPLRQDVQGFLEAVLLLTLFGVIDDRFDLDFRIKFVGQIAAASIVALHGGVVIHHFPFLPGETLPQWLGVPLTVLVLVAVTNAINLSDGMDGLAGGISLLIIGFLGFLGYQAGDDTTVMLALAVIGGIFGFLRFNTYPARVFMGDCGSQFLGFSAGVLALIVTQKSNPALSPLLPLLVLGLPILDTAWVMLRRLAAGRSPFSPDRGHIHHRLLDLGLTQYEAVVVIYGIQIVLILAAYLLAYSWDLLICAAYGVFVLLLIQGMRLAEGRSLVHGFHPDLRAPSVVTRVVEWVKGQRLFTDLTFRLIEGLVPLMLVAGSLVAVSVSRDVGLLALILLALLLLALWIKPIPFFSLERLTTFSVAASVVYLVESSGVYGWTGGLRYVHLLFLLLALLVALWVRFAGSQFRVNTMDFLIVFIVLLVPNLPGFQHSRLGIMAIETMIFFYAAEALISSHERYWDKLRLGVIATLAVLGLRGLLGL